MRVVLRNCGLIDPENIEEYIAEDGYLALGRALTEMTPDDVIQAVLDSGLRGRGGAGFDGAGDGILFTEIRRRKNPQCHHLFHVREDKKYLRQHTRYEVRYRLHLISNER